MISIMATATTTAVHQGIVVSGPEPLVIDPTSAKRLPAFNAEEARLLTTEIQRTSVRLWLLVTEAHDRAAHFALGYESWDDYVRAEFKMSPSRSYQLLDTGHVMRSLAAAGADIDHMPPPPARVVARIKNRLPAVRKATRAALKAGDDPAKALRDLAREPLAPTATKPDAPPVPTQRNGSDIEPGQPPPEVRTNLVTCPACDGDGKVTRGLANRLRPFMKKLVQSANK